MSGRINYSRVRRIKNIIYTFIVLLFLVPAILLIVLGVQMISYLGPIRSIIAQSQDPPPYAAGAPYTADPSGQPPEFPVPPGLQTQPGDPVEDILEPEDPGDPREGTLEPEDLTEPDGDDPDLLSQRPAPRLEEPGTAQSGGAGGASPLLGTPPPPPDGGTRIPPTGLPRQGK